MEYILVRAATCELLAARVTKALAEGWLLQGGVGVGHDPVTGDRYFQAVVRDAVLGELAVVAEAEEELPAGGAFDD